VSSSSQHCPHERGQLLDTSASLHSGTRRSSLNLIHLHVWALSPPYAYDSLFRHISGSVVVGAFVGSVVVGTLVGSVVLGALLGLVVVGISVGSVVVGSLVGDTIAFTLVLQK